MLEHVVGYDTAVASALQSNGKQSVYLVHARKTMSLSQAPSPIVAALCSSLLLYCVCTSTVSIALRETQRALIKFSWAWRAADGNSKLSTLISHVSSSLIIAPTTMGLFYIIRLIVDDSMLAFMMQALVWLCELFSAVSRARHFRAQFWKGLFYVHILPGPRFPLGYSYVAFVYVFLLQATMYALWLTKERPL